jgi:hypothetical protein
LTGFVRSISHLLLVHNPQALGVGSPKPLDLPLQQLQVVGVHHLALGLSTVLRNSHVVISTVRSLHCVGQVGDWHSKSCMDSTQKVSGQDVVPDSNINI